MIIFVGNNRSITAAWF